MSETRQPGRNFLERLADRAEDPQLFPVEVTRLYREGKPQKARKALLDHAKRERNPRRARVQREAAAYLRGWLCPTDRKSVGGSWNGTGTRLLGEAQREPDGTHIKTLWLSIFWLPIWPLESYLVHRQPGTKRKVLPGRKPATLRLLGRTPHPPDATKGRLATLTGIPVVAALIAFAAYRAGAEMDVYVYNGYDRPVWVSVGEQAGRIEPGTHATVSDVPTELTRFTAAWAHDQTPFESLTAALGGQDGNIVVYNIGGRGLLAIARVVYGESDEEPPEDEILDPGPILSLSGWIAFRFDVPPDSVFTGPAGTSTRRWLRAIDEPAEPADAVTWLAANGRSDRAIQLARAELLVNPDNVPLIVATAYQTMEVDLSAALELVDEGLLRHPGDTLLTRARAEITTDGALLDDP